MNAPSQASAKTFTRIADAVPPQAWFAVSAVFHYLGPAFAVLLFPHIGVLGVAWLRIAIRRADLRAADEAVAHLARARPAPAQAAGRLRRLPGADELLVLSGAGAAADLAGRRDRVRRHDRRRALRPAQPPQPRRAGDRGRRRADPDRRPAGRATRWGLAWALVNGAFFVGYIILGHRLAASGASNGVANLGAAMAIACLLALPIGFGEAMTAFSSPTLLAAAVGVGLCSSVIPYICDQLAMSRLPRASFALLLALLPATATSSAPSCWPRSRACATSSASRWS